MSPKTAYEKESDSTTKSDESAAKTAYEKESDSTTESDGSGDNFPLVPIEKESNFTPVYCNMSRQTDPAHLFTPDGPKTSGADVMDSPALSDDFASASVSYDFSGIKALSTQPRGTAPNALSTQPTRGIDSANDDVFGGGSISHHGKAAISLPQVETFPEPPTDDEEDELESPAHLGQQQRLRIPSPIEFTAPVTYEFPLFEPQVGGGRTREATPPAPEDVPLTRLRADLRSTAHATPVTQAAILRQATAGAAAAASTSTSVPSFPQEMVFAPPHASFMELAQKERRVPLEQSPSSKYHFPPVPPEDYLAAFGFQSVPLPPPPPGPPGPPPRPVKTKPPRASSSSSTATAASIPPRASSTKATAKAPSNTATVAASASNTTGPNCVGPSTSNVATAAAIPPRASSSKVTAGTSSHTAANTAAAAASASNTTGPECVGPSTSDPVADDEREPDGDNGDDDDADNDHDVRSSSVTNDGPGRFRGDQRRKLDACIFDMHARMSTCAASSGLSERRILRVFVKEVDSGRHRRPNLWNRYQTYSLSAQHRLEEMRRVRGADAEEEEEDLDQDERKLAYRAFMDYYGDDTEEILSLYEELAVEEIDQTHLERGRLLTKVFSNGEKMVSRVLQKYGLEGCVMFVGSYLNEDAQVAKCYLTPGLSKLAETLHLSHDDFLGAVKLTAYNAQNRTLNTLAGRPPIPEGAATHFYLPETTADAAAVSVSTAAAAGVNAVSTSAHAASPAAARPALKKERRSQPSDMKRHAAKMRTRNHEESKKLTQALFRKKAEEDVGLTSLWIPNAPGRWFGSAWARGSRAITYVCLGFRPTRACQGFHAQRREPVPGAWSMSAPSTGLSRLATRTGKACVSRDSRTPIPTS
ncbi:hypothetical protein K438DRAFT_915355 [Mycena galopus ATCC 62051]|nr:hypothetical protein K438DRAFT_915355 [Mycena galopus ATCC 62051]